MSAMAGRDRSTGERRHFLGRRRPVWIHCTEHALDLAALQRYVADGRPAGGEATVAAIRQGECPACRPRYLASSRDCFSASPPAVTVTGGRHLVCGCCGTSWEAAPGGWKAVAGGGLRADRDERSIKAGKAIDGSRYFVEPVNPVEGVEEALRGGFLEFDASAGQPAADDLVDDVTEAMLASYRGAADERAELARIKSEHQLDDEAADRWQFVALAGLGVVRGLRRNGSPPARHSHREGFVPAASRSRFEELVASALDSIPPELACLIENVAVVVEDEAATGDLFGLYEGIPLTARGRYGGAAPDRITIYQDAISARCLSEAEIVAQVRQTVIHEVGHHFGIDDGRLHQLGW